MLEYELVREFSATPTEQECAEIVDLARSMLAAGQTLRQRIETVAKRRSKETQNLLSMIQARLVSL